MDPELAVSRTHAEWNSLLEDVRSYQQRIGFEPTPNFRRADEAKGHYAFCAHASPLYLPYSYQDPAIRWLNARTEEECRAAAENWDMSFRVTDVVAGVGTPVTGKMLVAPLPRFLYLVMHEDCHEQFGLPSGIEEALCNALAYAGMEQIARERFNDWPIEYRAISDYVRAGAASAEFTLGLYEAVSALYAQHEGGLISEEALLQQRGEIFRSTEQRLARAEGTHNNVWLAFAITYSRHYRLMRRVIDAFDGDLAQTVAFFRRLDAAKPAPTSFAARHGCASQRDVGFVRAYEAAIAAIVERSLQAGNMLDGAGVPEWIGEGALDPRRCRQDAADGRREAGR